MATPVGSPPPYYTAAGIGAAALSPTEFERSMARATMGIGAGLLSAGLIWQLSNSGGPRSLMLIGGALSAFGWAWFARVGGDGPEPTGDSGLVIDNGQYV